MNETVNYHDRFFQETFSRREIAESFIRHHLPQSLVSQMDFSTLTIVKDSFVDKELREHFSDILYTVQIKENLLYIYLLFEHKSRQERFVSLQILRYMVKIWDQHVKQNPKTKKLPPVFPMVLYHGRGKWNISEKFEDTVQDEKGLMKAYIPKFCYEIYDISHMPDEQIKGEVLARIVLLIAKYIFKPDMKEKVFETARLFQEVVNQETALEILEVLLRYVTQATGKFEEGDIRKIIGQTSIREDIMQTFIDKYINQGMQLGMQQGLQQMAKIFLRQMEIRFGGVPEWAEEKIRQADMKRIEEWSIRLLKAERVEDVLV
ncbi:MAG: Rpn family recombination-promoting nuclease/putative transposase [Desulfococcaceae bacterium]